MAHSLGNFLVLVLTAAPRSPEVRTGGGVWSKKARKRRCEMWRMGRSRSFQTFRFVLWGNSRRILHFFFLYVGSNYSPEEGLNVLLRRDPPRVPFVRSWKPRRRVSVSLCLLVTVVFVVVPQLEATSLLSVQAAKLPSQTNRKKKGCDPGEKVQPRKTIRLMNPKIERERKSQDSSARPYYSVKK